MSRSTPIEIAGQSLGVVVPEGDRFRFVAVKYKVWPLDGRSYPSVEEARRDIGAHLIHAGDVEIARPHAGLY